MGGGPVRRGDAASASKEPSAIRALITLFRQYPTFFYHRLFPFAGAVLLLFGVYYIAQLNEPAIRDHLMRRSAPALTQSKATLVLIDEQSEAMLAERFRREKRFRRYENNREAYVELFEKLQAHEPALMVFDSVFSRLTPNRDAPIIEQLTRFDNLVVGHALHYADNNAARIPAYFHLDLGVVNMVTDRDSVVRVLRPIFTQPFAVNAPGSDGVYLSLPVEATSRLLALESQKRFEGGERNWFVDLRAGPGGNELRLFPEESPQGGRSAPLDRNGNIILRWFKTVREPGAHYSRSHYAIPVCRLYDACESGPRSLTAQDKAMLRDRVAIVGSSSLTHSDFLRTPMSARHLGADILATGIDNLYYEKAMYPVAPWQNGLLLILFATPIFYLRLKLQRLGPTFLYAIALMIFYYWLAQRMFEWGVVMDVLTPEVFMAVALTGGSVFREVLKNQEVRVLQKNLSKLVSREVFLEIQKMDKGIQAGGNRMEITAAFVDLRNFTRLSERLSPTDLKDILNEFYTEIERVTMRHRGIIDKFLGDGVLMIFGAPWPTDEHADEALAAAQDAIEATRQLIVKWEREKQIQTRHDASLDVGVAINSGNVFVGFLGTPERVAYTAVGDAVNLCARLQDQTKVYHTRLILSEYTAAALTNDYPLEPLDVITVRGRQTPLRIYTLPGFLYEAPPDPQT